MVHASSVISFQVYRRRNVAKVLGDKYIGGLEQNLYTLVTKRESGRTYCVFQGKLILLDSERPARYQYPNEYYALGESAVDGCHRSGLQRSGRPSARPC